MVLKGLICIISTLAGYVSLEITGFGYFLHWDGVVVLKGLILDHWLIWYCQITTYRIENCCLFFLTTDCHTGQSFGMNCASGQLY